MNYIVVFTNVFQLNCSVAGADMKTLINMGYSIAERDAEQKTARDVAENAGMTENVEAIG